MLSLSMRFLFIHVPKTAGNSIQSLLMPYADERVTTDEPHQDGVERFGLLNDRYGTTKHSTMTEYRRALDRKTFSRLYKFSVARNPWERMISWYFSPHRGVTAFDREDFIAFVRSRPTLRQHIVAHTGSCRLRALLGRSPRPLTADLDFLVRYESLDEDLARVFGALGITYKPLPVRNKSQRRHYSTYYDEELRAVVADRFREEIEHLGYEFTTSSGETPCLSSVAV